MSSHDNGHHHGHGDEAVSCPMIMTFHAGHCESILWKSWTARTITEFFFSAFGIFVIAFVYEYLKYLREKYYHSVARAELVRISSTMKLKRCCQSNQNQGTVLTSSGVDVGINNSLGESSLNATTNDSGCCINTSEIEAQKSIREKIFNKAHISQTLLHFIQVLISYLLMLIVMTYNYWLCLAVVLGAAAGYFCFGWIRQQAVDFNEHCH